MIDISLIFIALVAVIIDLIVGEFPIKHPVQYFGNFINKYESLYYKNTINSGAILVIFLVFIVMLISLILQVGLFILLASEVIPYYVYLIVLGAVASTGLASKSLKDHIKRVLNSGDEDKRKFLSGLVSRNTEVLDDKKVYGSLIETHSENLSDGVIAPLFYLLILGLPGIMVFKAVSTMDSMIGYKNEKYMNFGKVAAVLDDVLNFIPARITGFLIWLLSKYKVAWAKWFQDAKRYSTSPNAGYPVAAAAYGLGVKLGGTVFYGEQQVDKAEIGEELTEDYEQASRDFIKIHMGVDILIVIFLSVFLLLDILY